VIQITNLVVEFGREANIYRAIDGISIDIDDGGSIGIMGPNGSGKTTLVRCLNGLLLPTSGQVTVDGLDTRHEEELLRIRRLVGMVFQNPENQIVSTTVEREIAFGLENLGTGTAEMHTVVTRMLETFNLVKYRNHPPHLLSGGEMQRLALASVMAMQPKYIVFDEPTSLLDPAGRRQVLTLLEGLERSENDSNSAVTPILVTQYPEEALLCDRLLIIAEGRLRYDGKPRDIFQNIPQLQEIGVDVPVEYEVNYHLQKLSANRLSLNPLDFMPIQ
jgi:energy-coupling factor transport system ATP-binding protein